MPLDSAFHSKILSLSFIPSHLNPHYPRLQSHLTMRKAFHCASSSRLWPFRIGEDKILGRPFGGDLNSNHATSERPATMMSFDSKIKGLFIAPINVSLKDLDLSSYKPLAFSGPQIEHDHPQFNRRWAIQSF